MSPSKERNKNLKLKWDKTTRYEKTNFWELFKLQLHLSASSSLFGICLMLLVGLGTSDMLRNFCSWTAEKDYEDWTIQKEDFHLCSMMHWSNMIYRPITNLWMLIFTMLCWGTYLYRSKKEKAFFCFCIFLTACQVMMLNIYPEVHYDQLDVLIPRKGSSQKQAFISIYWEAFCLGLQYMYAFYLLLTKGIRKGSTVLVVCACTFEICGVFAYAKALETVLNIHTPVWQIIAFRYIFHEFFWSVVLLSYRNIIRNCVGLETGAEALLMARCVTTKAIYARFLLVQLKGFGQIIAINFFDAVMSLLTRSLYAIYDEWYMQLQYGNRAAKAVIATAEENYLRTFEAQASTLASAPSVFLTGGLLLFGHFQPVAGEVVNTAKVVIDIVLQLATNFISDWLAMVAEDKFFAAQHLRVFNQRLSKWMWYMFAIQGLAVCLFMATSAYAPFCPKKYEHGIMMEYCGEMQ